MTLRRTEEEILQDLVVRAQAVLGHERTARTRSTLEQTARQLYEVSQAQPVRDIEPGFYHAGE